MLRSATKLATVTAVLTLVHDRTLHLDDPVAKFIPSFVVGEKGDITVRHLLSMTSGLSAVEGFSDDMPLAEAAEVIAGAPLAARPGTRFIYGNLGLTVAGRVAEVASGLSWPEFFRQSLAEPLGIDFTYGPLDSGRLGGGGRTTLSDYGVLLKMHLAGGVHEGRRILSERLVAMMQESNGADFTNPIRENHVAEQDYFGYGMPWWFDVVDGVGAPRVISVPGVRGAYPWIDRVRRYGGFLFVRRTLADGAKLYNDVRPLIEQALDASP